MRLVTLLIALLLALGVAGCSSGGDGDAGGGSAEVAAAEDDAGGGDASAFIGSMSGSGEGAGGAEPASAVPALAPRVVKTGSLRLAVGRGDFQQAVDEARAITAGLGGFVVESSAAQARRGRLVRGQLVVRVPARAYEQAVRELRRVGRVEGMRDEARDVSAEFVDLEARRRHLEAVERQLLVLLERAETVTGALAVQSQLNETQLQLEQVRGRLRFLEGQTTYATISLSIRERGVGAAPEGGGWGIVEAWRDGAQAFTTVAGKLFVVAAGAAPFILLAGIGFLAARFLRRRSALASGASRP